MTEIFFVLLVLVLGVLSTTSQTLRIQVLLAVFGGTAAIKADALSGATVTVPTLFVLFLWYRALKDARRSGQKLVVSHATFALGIAVCYGVLLAIFVPRFLAGELYVMGVSRALQGRVTLEPLKPVTGNVTQSAYAIGSVLTFAAGSQLMRSPARRNAFADAIIGLSFLNAAAAVLNVIEFYSGMPSLLDEVRTAYATTHQAWGMLPRIQGTFPETSYFSTLALGLFAFTFQLWLDRYRPNSSGVAAGLSLLCLVFSTSGTAYAGLLVYSAILSGGLLRRAAKGHTTPRLAWALVAAPLLLAVGQFVVLFDAALLANVGQFFSETVLQKMESDSGQERGSWNAAAWHNFLDTYGLGLGLGSVRTSSFLLTLLSNLGAIGSLFYLLFLSSLFRTPKRVLHGSSPDEWVIVRASRHALLACFGAACISTTVFDLGAVFYLYAAAATPLASRAVAPSGSTASSGMQLRAVSHWL
jgi:hypothetical protein